MNQKKLIQMFALSIVLVVFASFLGSFFNTNSNLTSLNVENNNNNNFIQMATKEFDSRPIVYEAEVSIDYNFRPFESRNYDFNLDLFNKFYRTELNSFQEVREYLEFENYSLIYEYEDDFSFEKVYACKYDSFYGTEMCERESISFNSFSNSYSISFIIESYSGDIYE